MALHKNLTGTDLHEPKGAAAASVGQVYIADGAGSGAWASKNGDILNANKFTMSGDMPDIGAAANATFFYIPMKSQLTRLSCVLYAGLTAVNAILTIYIDGVLFADSLTVPFTGSTAGTKATVVISTANTLNEGSVVEVRSDGGPTNSVRAAINLLMTNKA